MNARERWQALQSHLVTATAAAERGEHARALEALDHALAIDPEFLAARALRERLMTAPAAAPPPEISARPLVSEQGYARFEERARRRRVDRRIDAARHALARGRLREAAAAMQEVRELDPNAPELASFAATLAAARLARNHHGYGAWAFAAVTFAVVLFAATRPPESDFLIAHPIIATAPLVEGTAPPPLVRPQIDDTPAPQTLQVVPVAAPTPVTIEPIARTLPQAADDEPVVREIPRVTREEARIEPLPLRPPAPAAATPAPAPATVAAEPVVAPIAPLIPIAPRATDESLVQQTLQRYRTAYEGLDAASAHAVWPAVNQAALARAFDGLESQSLTFDDCNVRLLGETANAVCRGMTRYVPKVGSREPRVEPRTWTFTLRKLGPDWKIESARAQQ